MKNLIRSTTLALLAIPLAAQAPRYWVGVQGGYDWQGTDSRNAKNNGILGVTAGTWCTDRWGGDVSVLGTQLKSKINSSSADEYHGDVSALLNLSPTLGTVVPYLRLGVGGTQVGSPFSLSPNTTVRFNETGGVGLQFLPQGGFLLGLEGRAVHIETRTSYTEYLGLVTLGFRWGAPAAMPVAAQPAPAPAPIPPPPPAPVPEPAPAPAPAPAPEPAPAPAPVVVAPAPQPPPPAKIVLDEAVLHFANGKSVIPAEGVTAIQKVADSLKAYHGDYTLVVTGYTSSVGTPAFNKALSKRRADAVAKVLVDNGIPAGAIQTVGAGPDNPIADNKTKAGQARNRRVEIDVKAAGVESQKIETSATE